MATTYLDITNEVLRELNEVVLTSGNFSSATGIQKFVKDSINKSIFSGSTINTPSMLCIEDLLDSLNWIKEIGGLTELIKRTDRNFKII